MHNYSPPNFRVFREFSLTPPSLLWYSKSAEGQRTDTNMFASIPRSICGYNVSGVPQQDANADPARNVFHKWQSWQVLVAQASPYQRVEEATQ